MRWWITRQMDKFWVKPVQSKRPFEIFINGFFIPRTELVITLMIIKTLVFCCSIANVRETIWVENLNNLTHYQLKKGSKEKKRKKISWDKAKQKKRTSKKCEACKAKDKCFYSTLVKRKITRQPGKVSLLIFLIMVSHSP